jgi:hypothetical protein
MEKEFMDDGLNAFLAENAIKAEDVAYAASSRFLGKDRKPAVWKLRVLTSEENDVIIKHCKKKEFVPGTRDVKISTDNEKYVTELVCASVVFPNLNAETLQDSYGAVGAAELIHKMLTPGEFTDLASAVQEACGFEVGMKDKIDRAKN